MTVPSITPMQFLVLRILSNGECSGREIRAQLKSKGVKRSGAAFYEHMARMEDAKLVIGSYVEKTIEGQRVRERRYEITGDGLKAFESAREFYAEK